MKPVHKLVLIPVAHLAKPFPAIILSSYPSQFLLGVTQPIYRLKVHFQ